MIPGNVDPRRPEKVQRYKPPQANGNPPVEDLTPDYMNILGPDSATANAGTAESGKSADPLTEEPASIQDPSKSASNGTNVIPTSPQYGVAIISNDVPSEATTISTDTVVETTAKSEGDNKEMHSTPSRNDRFKVVKIASLEPFRRGRWKCMDYVDENPPTTTTTQSKSSQSTTNLQMGGNVYLQTQSLPQQHFQQMLVQGAFTNSPQYYQNLPTQIIPQSQYFYPAQNVGNIQQNSIQQPFINAGQTYFPQNVVPNSTAYTNYTNVQYVPSNLIQNQNSAFVPTSQNVNPQLPPNFQQSQTYAGPPSGSQPIVNGHSFPQATESQVVVSSLPTQAAKNVIISATPVNPSIQGNLVNNNPVNQQQQVAVVQTQPFSQASNTVYQPASVPAANTQQTITQVPPTVSSVAPIIPAATAPSGNPSTSVNQVPASASSVPTSFSIPSTISVNLTQIPTAIIQQGFDPHFATNVYTNPQFVASVNSIPPDTHEHPPGENVDPNTETENPNGEDPSKANPVVNAIDNKIEQAMDLVKSHLMYTVREEVEVLKEKIAELMERIQQLETENAFLKQQIPKGQNNITNGMIFSMCGLMMRLKWCAWVALYCSCISFANSRLSDDTKQILSSFMLSISAIVMSYLQNPQPMTPPWATSVN